MGAFAISHGNDPRMNTAIAETIRSHPRGTHLIVVLKGHGFSRAKKALNQIPFHSAEGRSAGEAETTELLSSKILQFYWVGDPLVVINERVKFLPVCKTFDRGSIPVTATLNVAAHSAIQPRRSIS
jgi:hypothetical protein